jgi:hypothetical protein
MIGNAFVKTEGARYLKTISTIPFISFMIKAANSKNSALKGQ